MGFELLFIFRDYTLEQDSFDLLIAKLQAEVDKRDLEDFSAHALNLLKNPQNLKSLPLSTPGLVSSDGYSDCGDYLKFFIVIHENKLCEISYIYHGCDITTMVASQFVLTFTCKSIDDAKKISSADILYDLGKFPQENFHTILFVKEIFDHTLEQYEQIFGEKNG